MDVQIHETGPGSGNSRVTWTGPLTIAGINFDTSAPQIAGTTSKLGDSSGYPATARFAITVKRVR
jgi:NADPH-dependent ferric siderophore reductase